MLTPRAEAFKNELISALQKELEIARKLSQGERSNEAIEGAFIKRTGSGFVYEFENLTGFPPDEGIQVSFNVGDKNTQGRFLGEVNSKFVFELEADLGEKISRVTVVSDPLFLLEKQIETLSKTYPFENQLALASVGLASYPAAKSISCEAKFMHGLNGLQQESLTVVSENPVTYIWGPPGTGKTTTMGSVVAALADAGLRVLLVSNTNLALDTALERCLDRYSEFSDLSDGLMLRLGTMVKPELIKTYSSKIELDVIHQREVKQLQDEITRISSSLGKVRDEISDLKDLKREYEKSTLQASGVSKVNTEIESLKKDVTGAREKLDDAVKVISKLEAEYKIAVEKGGVSRFFSGTRNPNEIKREINDKQLNKEKLDTEIMAKNSQIGNLEAKSSQIEAEAEIGKKWLQQNPDASKKLMKIPSLEAESLALQKQIENIKEEISKKREEILNRAKVVACTAFKTILDPELSKQSFDCVVVDEASMLPLPLYYCAASLAKGRIVIAGDFRQLPPIVRIGSTAGSDLSPEDEKLRDLLAENPFTKSGVIVRGAEASELVALRDQYRMRQEISDLISQNFYPEHTLRTANSRTDKSTPWGNDPFIFIDTTSLEPESSTVNGKSRRNVSHALVVRALVEKLYDDGWQFDSTSEKSFAVITPYAKQSIFIENLIAASGEIKVKGGVSTVHRFQGNERDLIIIDLTKVASQAEPGLGDFLGNPDPLARQNAMWNVAISRARQHVIVIGHDQTLKQNSGSIISQLVHSMTPNMKTIDASSIVDVESIVKIKPISKTGNIAWFTGSNFYEKFSDDLSNSKTKVFLASPFSTKEGTDRWKNHFKSLKQADVEMICLTKPVAEKSNSADSAEIHAELEEFFKEVRTVPKMHEKIAVIDNRIVWLGSLNILSHKNSSEIMMRIDSPDFAKSITDEYLLLRSPGQRAPRLNPNGTKIKAGDPCDSPGCSGEMILRPAGISKKSGRPYAAFLSCNQFPRCKNSVNF